MRCRRKDGVWALSMLVAAASVALAGCASSSLALFHAGDSWGRTQTLVSPGSYAADPQLAVGAGGVEIVGWFGGPRPRAFAIGFAGRTYVKPRALAASGPVRSGEKVFADLGEATRGFGRPVLLSRSGAGGDGQLRVALSASGVAYVAWFDSNGRWMITAIRSGHVSAPRAFLPRGAQLQALLSASKGPVAAVWEARFSLKYALLASSGRLQQITMIAHLHHDDASPELAINDYGQLAAAWTRGYEGANGKVTATAAVCRPKRGCARSRALTLGGARPNCEQLAVTISDDGTVAVLAAGQDMSLHGCTRPLGVWAATGRRGASVGAMRRLAPAGNFPFAVAAGRGGALVVFNPTSRRLAWSVLRPNGGGFSKPRLLERRTVYSPAVAANLHDHFVVAWNRSNRDTNPVLSLWVTEGNGTHSGQGQLVAPTRDDVQAQTFAGGIDGYGDAVVIWQDFSSKGTGGLFAASHRQ